MTRKEIGELMTAKFKVTGLNKAQLCGQIAIKTGATLKDNQLVSVLNGDRNYTIDSFLAVCKGLDVEIFPDYKK